MTEIVNKNLETAAKPKKSRHWLIVLTVVVAILVVTCVGFFVWHEQPSFCNAICHSPMDPYVEGYENDNSLLSYAHGQAGTTCLACHEPKLSEQVAEGITWIQGDFKDPLKARKLATTEFCFRCHNDGNNETGMDWDTIIESTQNWGGVDGANPHDSHNGTLDCFNCHSVHGTSTLYCKSCHSSFKTPDGWK